jgi:lipopolysaccharide/colanic/teichoic acid biosynthesis glycosyltransferase
MFDTKTPADRSNGKRNLRPDEIRLDILDHQRFVRMLRAERKRNERSGRRFVLMLLECTGAASSTDSAKVFREVIRQLLLQTRETDIKGWYKEQTVFGVIFTELEQDDRKAVVSTLLTRMSNLISGVTSEGDISRIRISFHVFPDDLVGEKSGDDPDLTLYLDKTIETDQRRTILNIKRIIDVLLSILVIALLSPAFVVIALMIKLTSPGPVLFRQQRLGRFGRSFELFKFRSMNVVNDESIHVQFVDRLIRGEIDRDDRHEPNQVYKNTKEPRETWFGKFLRRSSLDELPQFWNVLRGEMSIVGPRPPIAYEYARYSPWHRRRLLSVKPGITGLWQVRGRSRVNFDDMVRLDLLYSETWTIWLDLKILVKTPVAIVLGNGAH